MLVEFVVHGIPRTAQTKRSKSRREWRDRVSQAAAGVWPASNPAYPGEVSATIIYFYSDTTELDVDGIPKLILDAMTGIILEDDKTVSQVLCRKTPLPVAFLMTNPPAVMGDRERSADHFVYVRVSEPPDHAELPP